MLKSGWENIAQVSSLCSQSCMQLKSMFRDLSDDKTELKLLMGCADWYPHPMDFVQKAEVPCVDLCLNHSVARRHLSDSGVWFGCCTRELLNTLLASYILFHKQTSGGTLDFKRPFIPPFSLKKKKSFPYAYCFRPIFQNDTLVPKIVELSTSLMMHCSLST